MYLSMLKENEKHLFLGFAYHVAKVDGDYSRAEEAVISSYCDEMKLSFDMSKIESSLDEIIHSMNSSCDTRSKKIIIFEIIGLAMSDDHYDEAERNIVLSASEKFGLSGDFSAKCEEFLNKYISFQSELNKLVLA